MKLENERYEVIFTTTGGEIQSFTDKQTGIQYMWQGDEIYWSGKNPGLFPIVGNTYTKDYEIDGKTYAMKNHGLIRYADLQVKHISEDTVIMELESSEEQLQQYPFPFHYEVIYRLEKNTLVITYRITNTGTKDMPFTFGLHPGFRCPLCEEETFEDYIIRFSNPETMEQLVFDKQFQTPYTLESRQLQTIPCDYSLFERYATLIYKHPKSAYVSLEGPKGHGVEVSIAGYPYFAIWTPKKNAPFLCLEPWYGHADYSKVDVAFTNREGMMSLSAGKTFTTSYTIKVY